MQIKTSTKQQVSPIKKSTRQLSSDRQQPWIYSSASWA
jgi:hypothetical protein